MFGAKLADYLSKHKIEDKVNDALNLALRNLPENPYEEISRVLKLQTAVKLSLRASPTIVREGITVRVKTVQGDFKATVPFFDHELEKSQSDPRLIYHDVLEETKQITLEDDLLSSTLDFVNVTLSLRLKHLDPIDQVEIDQVMKIELDKYAPEKESQERHLAERAVLATSMAISRAGASRKKSTLFEHISDIAERTEEKFIIPLPLISMLVGGTRSSNDLAVSEIISCPGGYKTFTEAFEASRRLEKSLQIISPQQMGRLEGGGFAPFWTRGVDQALSFAHDAIELSKSSDKMFFALDVSGETFFKQQGNEDEDSAYYDLGLNKRQEDDTKKKSSGDNDDDDDKNKERNDDDDDDDNDDNVRVTKQNPDQFLETIKDWCKKYGIRVVIDPFVTTVDAMRYWSALKRSFAESNITICAKSLLEVPEFKLPATLKEGRYDAANFRLTDHVTVSDAIKAVCAHQTKNVNVVLDQHNTTSCFLADFGVGLRCKMIRVRGCIGTSQQSLLERLQSIETDLTGGGGGGSKKKRGGRCKFAGFSEL